MNPRPVVLASASPARLALLRAAGIEPLLRPSGVDESAVTAGLAERGITDAVAVCQELASAKALDVVSAVRTQHPDALLVAADSLLDFRGTVLGKPRDRAAAAARWAELAGQSGVLCTGHHVLDCATGRYERRVVRTVVRFGRPDSAELDAYLASGEPMQVAGGFTIDGLGAPFVDGVQGDPSNVVGLSLPTLRTLLADLGVRWTDLWNRPVSGP